MKRVLIVEDEPGLAELLRRMLEDEGIDVSVVTTADAAISLAQPGLVVLDYGLPGRERVESFYPGIPQLLISGSPVVLERGGLQKPFAMQTFVERVKAALQEGVLHEPESPVQPS